jgi:hypothetical protein
MTAKRVAYCLLACGLMAACDPNKPDSSQSDVKAVAVNTLVSSGVVEPLTTSAAEANSEQDTPQAQIQRFLEGKAYLADGCPGSGTESFAPFCHPTLPKVPDRDASTALLLMLQLENEAAPCAGGDGQACLRQDVEAKQLQGLGWCSQVASTRDGHSDILWARCERLTPSGSQPTIPGAADDSGASTANK